MPSHAPSPHRSFCRSLRRSLCRGLGTPSIIFIYLSFFCSCDREMYCMNLHTNVASVADPYEVASDRKCAAYTYKTTPDFSACPSFEVLRQENPLVLCCTDKTLGVLKTPLFKNRPGVDLSTRQNNSGHSTLLRSRNYRVAPRSD